MKHGDLSEKIIGCVYEIYNVLGSGFLESVYEKAFEIELKKLEISVEIQKKVNCVL